MLRSCCSKCNRSASDRLALAATLSALPVAGHASAEVAELGPSWGRVGASRRPWWTVPVWSFVNNLSSLISSEYVRISSESIFSHISGTTWDDTKLTTLLEEQANAMVAHHAFGPGAKSERNTSGPHNPPTCPTPWSLPKEYRPQCDYNVTTRHQSHQSPVNHNQHHLWFKTH